MINDQSHSAALRGLRDKWQSAISNQQSAISDGFTSMQQNPTHVYSTTGLYTVTLAASIGPYTNTQQQTGYIHAFNPGQSAIAYTYDPLYRLTSATSLGANLYQFAYAYDAVGNRTAQTATITSTQVTTYTYDNANRMTKAGGVTYTWDNNPTPLRCGDCAAT